MNITSKTYLYKNYGQFYFADEKKTVTKVIYEPSIIDEKHFFFDLINGKDAFFIKENSYPLTICTPLKEEKVKIGQIEKKVNRLFIDEKIPLSLRKIWPCIKDKNGKIIYFPRKKQELKKDSIIFEIKN